MFRRNGIIEKAALMVNEVRDFRLSYEKNEVICEALDRRVGKHIEDFRLIGETAVSFAGTSGVEYLVNAVFDARGDVRTAQLMLQGIPD